MARTIQDARLRISYNLIGKSVTVSDDGRVIPVDIRRDVGRFTAEAVMTPLNAWGEFDDSSYRVSGGLHGTGVFVVNALCESLTLTIHLDGESLQ